MMFPWGILSDKDFALARNLIEHPYSDGAPDLVIAPDGEPYLYRWHIIKGPFANTYFHIQVSSDPERPLHDHPWDNMSVILSGGYDELFAKCPSDLPLKWNPGWSHQLCRSLRAGDTLFRKAEEPHRLILPDEFKYTMTLFSTGPKRREWGFWFPDGWRSYKEVTHLTPEGVSIHTGGKS